MKGEQIITKCWHGDLSMVNFTQTTLFGKNLTKHLIQNSVNVSLLVAIVHTRLEWHDVILQNH